MVAGYANVNNPLLVGQPIQLAPGLPVAFLVSAVKAILMLA